MKICNKCKIQKDLIDFWKNNRNKDKVNSICKKCVSEQRKISYQKRDKIKHKEQRLKYETKNRDKILAKKREYTKKTKEQKQKYDIEYRLKNKDKIKQHKRNWHQKTKNIPNYKIMRNMRRRIHHALVDNYKSDNTINLLGCSIEEFIIYIEKQFYDEMTWDNYGSYWHIDHIKPCYTFDLSRPEQQKICFHYTNQRPLLAKDNLKRRRNDWYEHLKNKL